MIKSIVVLACVGCGDPARVGNHVVIVWHFPLTEVCAVILSATGC